MHRTRPTSRSPIVAISVAAGLLGAPTAAYANGRFPEAGQIALDPSDPAHILVVATYGLLVTSDSGCTWSWICEQAVGSSAVMDPRVTFTKDGTILVGTFVGLAVGHQGGCDWAFASGGLGQRYVVDVAKERADASHAVVLASNGADGGFLTNVWQTSDNGTTWTRAGTDLPGAFLGMTLDPAPSDPKRIYVSGTLGAPKYPGVLERSKDGGATWEKLPIPDCDDPNEPFIAAIDPKNADTVYVRIRGSMSDRLIVSKDGGVTWSTLFTALGRLLGFALSPDGATVAVGGPTDGLWTAPSSTFAFKQVSEIGPKCLTWSDKGLYICADEFRSGFTAGLSTDQGATFTSIMHLQGLCGPLACAPSTPTGSLCPMGWEVTKLAVGGATCEGGGRPSYCAAGTGAGTASASANASGATGGAQSSGGACACSAPGAASAALLPGGALALLAAITRRRRSAAAPRRRP